MMLEPFPVLSVSEIPLRPSTTRWLVENLWAHQAVGILGGIAKLGKTWLALDLAVSVASGTPALGVFAVPTPGTVLVFAAEDSLSMVRDRIAAMAQIRGISLDSLPLHLLDSPTVRLDSKHDLRRLRLTLDALRPCLLVLDPLVRLHSADENSATDVASLLGELRTIQREYQMAILLVHHLRKNGPMTHPGQALLGSGDLHAWGDDNLYLHSKRGQLVLTVEHRHAPAPEPVPLELVSHPAPHLAVASEHSEASSPDPMLEQRVLELLRHERTAVDRETLRRRLRTRNQTLGLALVRLRQTGDIERCAGGFRLRHQHPTIPIPDPTQRRERNGPHLL